MKPQIGFIGIMGKAMAKNLVNAGYPLTVWNRTTSKMKELSVLGAKETNSPKEVAERSDIVIIMVTDSPDVEKIILGPSGVLEGIGKGSIVIDMSTISPEVTRKIEKILANKDVMMLDAPVSGGEKGAIERTLSIMVGGSRKAFERCLPILEVLGKKVIYMGSSGMGQTAKLCNQVICALNIQAVCEGLILGAKAGLDLEKLLEVVTAGAANSWMLSNLGPKMIKGDYEPGFKIKHQQKDIRIALSSAAELNLPLPATGLVHQIFRIAETEGFSEKGTQALIIAMEKITGTKIIYTKNITKN